MAFVVDVFPLLTCLVPLPKVLLEEEMKKFEGQPYAQFKALKSASTRLYQEQQRRQKERSERFGNVGFAAQVLFHLPRPMCVTNSPEYSNGA